MLHEMLIIMLVPLTNVVEAQLVETVNVGVAPEVVVVLGPPVLKHCPSWEHTPQPPHKSHNTHPEFLDSTDYTVRLYSPNKNC
eukprot:5094544-Amphidinium_carterae.1